MDPLLLKHECERCAKYARARASASRRRELKTAIGSKWEGVQVAAARALCAWGDEASLDLVMKALVPLSKRTPSTVATRTIAKALAPHLGKAHVSWVFDLYFKQANPTYRSCLHELFAHLPREESRKLLAAYAKEYGCGSRELRLITEKLSSLLPAKSEESAIRSRPRQPKPAKRRNELPPYDDD